PAAGLVCAGPTCTAPFDPLAEFPPPTCTAPVELDALLPPLPPMLVGALTLAELPAALAEAEGEELVGLTCTAPVELLAVLLPFETDVGAETAAPPAPADGFTLVPPA